MRLLVVEDDSSIADFVCTGLREAGYAVDHAGDGEEAFALALNEPYDAAVVDLMLPRLDGLGLIERMRGSGIATPVLILSARRSVDDRVRGLQTGGDDYLTKPFAFAELLARVQALVRRGAAQAEPTRIVAGPVVLDLIGREVRREGTPIELHAREFALLELLMRSQGRVVSKTAIHQSVWDFDFNPRTNVVEVLVHRLRQKLDEPFATPLIHTVRGAGYVFRAP
jgi:two-component system OmpR family response regulator